MDQLHELCQLLEDEIPRRSMRSTYVEVLDYQPSSVIPASQLAPTGTIGVYVSHKGSPLLREIRDAVQDTKGGGDRKLARRIVRTIQQKRPMPADEAARRMVTQPVLASLNYAGSTMVRHLFAESENDLFVTVLPYAGGPLVENGFRLDEYLYEDDDEPLECVLVRNPPILSPAEETAIKKLPPDMIHAYVSPLPLPATLPLAAIALYVVVWGTVYVTFTIVKAAWHDSAEHINPQALDNVGPTAAVRALLQLRIDILKGRIGNSPPS